MHRLIKVHLRSKIKVTTEQSVPFLILDTFIANTWGQMSAHNTKCLTREDTLFTTKLSKSPLLSLSRKHSAGWVADTGHYRVSSRFVSSVTLYCGAGCGHWWTDFVFRIPFLPVITRGLTRVRSSVGAFLTPWRWVCVYCHVACCHHPHQLVSVKWLSPAAWGWNVTCVRPMATFFFFMTKRWKEDGCWTFRPV